MKHKDIKPMTPFDSLTQNESMRMLKLMIPFLSPSVQKMLSVYIKYMEFQNTLQYFKDFDSSPLRGQSDPRELSFTDILEEIRPYMSDSEGESIDSILSAMQMMEFMGSMSQSPFDFSSYTNTEETENHMEREETENSYDELDGKSPISGAGSFETGADQERRQADLRKDRP